MSADTGVGPSIASGSHVCNGTWADLPTAPRNSPRPSSTHSSWLNSCGWPCDSFSFNSEMFSVPKVVKAMAMPTRNPASPTRLTTNALFAAVPAVFFSV
jgi:hypothetical protein